MSVMAVRTLAVDVVPHFYEARRINYLLVSISTYCCEYSWCALSSRSAGILVSVILGGVESSPSSPGALLMSSNLCCKSRDGFR